MISIGVCTKKLHGLFGTCVLMCALLGGCGLASDHYRRDYAGDLPAMHRLLLMPPEIRVFDTSSDGSTHYSVEQSCRAAELLQQSAPGALTTRNLAMAAASPSLLDSPESRSIQALYKSVDHSIQLHVFGSQIFPGKQKQPDYSLGSVSELLKEAGADGLLMIHAYQLNDQQHATGWMTVAVVEPGGTLIWYDLQKVRDEAGLLTPGGVQSLLGRALAGLGS